MKSEDKKQPEAVDADRAARPTSPPTPGSLAIWLLVEPQVDAVPADQVVAPRIDLQAAAVTALSVTSDVGDDKVILTRFAAMAAIHEIERDIVTKVARLAGAAWYARHRQLQAEASQTLAVVPEALVAQGDELLTRMLKLAQYHFEDHATEGALVAAINNARGHSRLANHLLSLSELYHRHPDVVSSDAKHYRKTDERDARKTSEAIVAALADDSASEVELWKGRSARVWTLLSRAYGDMQYVGRWFLRANPELAAERFPSLVGEVRAVAAPRKVVAPAPEPAPSNGTSAPVTPRDAVVAAPAPRRRRGR